MSRLQEPASRMFPTYQRLGALNFYRAGGDSQLRLVYQSQLGLTQRLLEFRAWNGGRHRKLQSKNFLDLRDLQGPWHRANYHQAASLRRALDARHDARSTHPYQQG